MLDSLKSKLLEQDDRIHQLEIDTREMRINNDRDHKDMKVDISHALTGTKRGKKENPM